MASELLSETRAADHAGTTTDGETPWADLEVTVPTDRDHASVVALVECALVELTHATARRLVNDLVDADVVTSVPEDHILVHEPSGAAFDSSTQLAVFHRGWTAGRDAEAEGE